MGTTENIDELRKFCQTVNDGSDTDKEQKELVNKIAEASNMNTDSGRGKHIFVELMPDTKVALSLLDVGAVRLSPNEPFTWASGWKSPIYCDNRVSLSFPDQRKIIKEAIVDAILENFRDVDAIVAVATAGIAQGALVAEEIGLPFLYVRSTAKDHGLGNMIEGRLEKGWKVVVIEDLVSTGASSLKAVESIREAGGDVIGMVTNFTYGFDVARKAFKEADVELVSITDYNVLINVAKIMGLVTDTDLKLLKAWRKDPANWGKE